MIKELSAEKLGPAYGKMRILEEDGPLLLADCYQAKRLDELHVAPTRGKSDE